MYVNRDFSDTAPSASEFRASGASRRAGRRMRRAALRHDRLTVADHVAYWQANRRGRLCSRDRSTSPWPVHLRVLLVMIFLVAGLTVGVLFA